MGKQIKIEDGGSVKYNGCSIAKGKAGNDFLSTSAKASRTDTTGHTTDTGWKQENHSWRAVGTFGRDENGNVLPENQNWKLYALDKQGNKIDPAENYEETVEAPVEEAPPVPVIENE